MTFPVNLLNGKGSLYRQVTIGTVTLREQATIQERWFKGWDL